VEGQFSYTSQNSSTKYVITVPLGDTDIVTMEYK